MYRFLRRHRLTAVTLAIVLTASPAIVARATQGSAQGAGGASKPSFSNPGKIDNRYLPLTAKRRCVQRGEEDDGTKTRSVRTVLDRTKRFEVFGQPVDAVVIQDNAYANGELIEIAYDYFAQADSGTVYYLGEDVYNYENGKIANTDGTWLLGKDTDVPGVAMPANPKLGDQYRFEDVPGTTSESNRVEEVGMRAEANGKLHTGVIRISEFIQPEGDFEQKLYAPRVGKILEYPPDGRAEFAGCSG